MGYKNTGKNIYFNFDKKLCKFVTHCIKCNNFNLVKKFLFNPTVLKVDHSVDPKILGDYSH